MGTAAEWWHGGRVVLLFGGGGGGQTKQLPKEHVDQLLCACYVCVCVCIMFTRLQVPLDGVSVDFVNPSEKVPKAALQEMRW